ncbi:MAG TPA: sugar phosphate isomerase/epimerase family protein [Armatimonadota bacterium]
MFPIAVITDEICHDFLASLDRLKDWGVGLAEIRGVNGKNVTQLSDEELLEARRALDARGLRACGVASPFYKCDLPAGDGDGCTPEGDALLESQMRVFARCLRAAEILGTSFIRVFAFWRKGPTTQPILDVIRRAYQRPLEKAEEAGVTLLLENEHDCYLSTGAEVASFLEGCSSPALRCVWDPGNTFAYGVQPFPQDYLAAKPVTSHIHLKDAVRDEGGHPRWVAVGDGDVGYASLFAALKEDRYGGILSLETHFSIGGDTEASTRACLEGVRRLLGSLS